MKKLFLMLVIMMLSSEAAFGYATWKEAYEAGIAKQNAGNLAGARADFTQALTLTTVGAEKSNAQLSIGHTYYFAGKHRKARIQYAKVLTIIDAYPDYMAGAQLHIGYSYYFEKDYPRARIELAKVLAMVDIHPSYKAGAQLHIGHSYYFEKNYPQTRIEFTKVLTMDVHPNYKLEAQLHIGHTYDNERDKVNAFAAYKAVFRYFLITDGDIKHFKGAFTKIVKLQRAQVTDWAPHVNWMINIAESVPVTSQEYTAFKALIVSQADGDAKANHLRQNKVTGEYEDKD